MYLFQTKEFAGESIYNVHLCPSQKRRLDDKNFQILEDELATQEALICFSTSRFLPAPLQ